MFETVRRAQGPDSRGEPAMRARAIGRSLRWRALGAALPVLVLACAAAAQTPPPAAPPHPTTVEGVVIQAPTVKPPTEEAVRSYVAASLRAPYQQSLARWRDPVCPSISGLDKEQAVYLIARLAEVTREAGIPMGKPRCEPNLFIIATPEPERLLRLWGAKNTRLFGDEGYPPRVRRFLETPRPVRVWYDASVNGGLDAAKSGEDIGAYGAGDKSASRLTYSGAVRNFDDVIVVIDSEKTKGLKAGQLADYVIMVSLAEINTDADQGDAQTILRLFDASATPPLEMSSWDKALLRALYRTSQDNRTQAGEIARIVAGAVAEPKK